MNVYVPTTVKPDKSERAGVGPSAYACMYNVRWSAAFMNELLMFCSKCWSKQTMETDSALRCCESALPQDNVLRVVFFILFALIYGQDFDQACHPFFSVSQDATTNNKGSRIKFSHNQYGPYVFLKPKLNVTENVVVNI